MNIIIDPNTNKKYSLFSKKGKKILKNLLQSHEGGMQQQQDEKYFKIPIRPGRRLPISEHDRRSQDTFSLIANRLRNQQPITLEGQAFRFDNVRRNIRNAIPDLVLRLRLLYDQQFNVIRSMSALFQIYFENSRFPHLLSDLYFFSENELQNFRRNNIPDLTQLTAIYLRYSSEECARIPPPTAIGWIQGEPIQTMAPHTHRNIVGRMYNFLKPLMDDNDDDVRRAIRILTIIQFISDRIQIMYPQSRSLFASVRPNEPRGTSPPCCE